MLRRALVRLREWIAVDDPEDRIEGTGEAIASAQHRRSAEADRLLREAESADEERPEPPRDG